jgi:hypothetical protein
MMKLILMMIVAGTVTEAQPMLTEGLMEIHEGLELVWQKPRGGVDPVAVIMLFHRGGQSALILVIQSLASFRSFGSLLVVGPSF